MYEQYLEYYFYEFVMEEVVWEEFILIVDVWLFVYCLYMVVWEIECKWFKIYFIVVQIGEMGVVIVLYVFLKFG